MRRGIRRSFTSGPSPVGAGGDGLGAADRRLLERIDRDIGEAAARAGPLLRCGPGCSDCCHGPFPVTRLDAWRLRRGLVRLERDDPERARAIRKRADDALRVLRPGYPGDPETGRLQDDVGRLDRFLAGHESLACPALDPATGRCDLYAWRPVSCRIYGPPLSFDGGKTAPCELCFRGAGAEQVESCRIAPDPEDIEASLLRSMGAADGEPWNTLVAFALPGVESFDAAGS